VPQRRYVDKATPSGVLSISYRVRGERVGGVSSYSSPVALPMGAGAVPGRIARAWASGREAG
jgi:hypothetical protein